MLKHDLLAFVLGIAAAAPSAVAAQDPPTATRAPPKPSAVEEAVFEMREVPALEKPAGPEPTWLMIGQFAELTAGPDKQVKAYPKLRSARARYGSIRLNTPDDSGKGPQYRFVVDESGGTGKGYDRLYFDANADLDLANDPVLKPMRDPPPRSIVRHWKEKQTVFDYAAVPVDYGPGIGRRPFRLLSRCVVEGEKLISVQFIATVMREGGIRIGTRRYGAVLVQNYAVAGRFDWPWTKLFLEPLGTQKVIENRWSDDDLLGAARWVDGRFYTVTATPTGDKLTVRPYLGDFGVLTVGPGPRKIEKLAVGGEVNSANMIFPLGTLSADGASFEKARECRVPVGDYLPTYMGVTYGRISFSFLKNYHSDGRPRDRQGRPPVYFIKIRKDKPFVLDFANKPEVMFVSPARHQVLKPGDELHVAAVLVDPVLDIMIRRMHDTSRKQKEGYKLPNGTEHIIEGPLSLDPTVTITNSSGKKVAEGKMPFG